MVWFKVDDQLAVHVKAVSAGNAAMGLWVRAGAWCSAQLTDGRLPAAMVRALDGTDADARRLVAVGLWVAVEGGYLFHDWDEWQPSKEQVLAERAAGRERVAKSRARAKERQAFARTDSERSATPSRPVPSPDYYPPLMSQSLDNRESVGTDAEEPSEITRRMAGQKGIRNLSAIAKAIGQRTDRIVSPTGALQVASWLLEKARTWPDNPQPYVIACINESAAEVQQYIDEIGIAS